MIPPVLQDRGRIAGHLGDLDHLDDLLDLGRRFCCIIS